MEKTHADSPARITETLVKPGRNIAEIGEKSKPEDCVLFQTPLQSPLFPEVLLLLSRLYNQVLFTAESSDNPAQTALSLCLEAGLPRDVCTMISLSTNWEAHRDDFVTICDLVARSRVHRDRFSMGIAHLHLGMLARHTPGNEGFLEVYAQNNSAWYCGIELPQTNNSHDRNFIIDRAALGMMYSIDPSPSEWRHAESIVHSALQRGDFDAPSLAEWLIDRRRTDPSFQPAEILGLLEATMAQPEICRFSAAQTARFMRAYRALESADTTEDRGLIAM